VLEYGLFEHDSVHLARRLNTFFLLYGDASSAMRALELGPIEKLESEIRKTMTIFCENQQHMAELNRPSFDKIFFQIKIQYGALFGSHGLAF
jgi:hypothetical protein